MSPRLSHRGRQTIPRLLPILDHTEPPGYLPPPYREPPRGGSDINLSTAENWVLRRELVPKFRDFISEYLTSQDLNYLSGFGGDTELLNGLSNFFNKYFNPVVAVQPDNLVTAPGASHLLESLFYHICDPSEAVLVSTPYWPGFAQALTMRNDIIPINVDIPFDNPDVDFFGPNTVQFYEQAIKSNPNITFRGLIICNPHNPIGKCYPVETLKALLRFAESYNLQVVVDELYGLSVYDYSGVDGKFVSALSIDLAEIQVDPSRVHVVYSFSKDLCSSGIRLGILVTQSNEQVRDSVASSQNAKVSTFTSLAATKLLQDRPALDLLLKANPIRLLRQYEILASFLNFHRIHYIIPKAGLFAFIRFLPIRTLPDITEDELDQQFKNAGVRLNAGKNLYSPVTGWFRLVFSIEEEQLIQGLRIVQVVLRLEGWTPPSTLV